MNVFIDFSVIIVCLTCVFSLSEDASKTTTDTPHPSKPNDDIPWQEKRASRRYSRDIARVYHNLTDAEVIISQGKPEFERPEALKRPIRDVAKSGVIGTGTVEMGVNLLSIQSDDYVYYEATKGSLKLHRSPAAWTDARLTCYDEGAELASPENQAMVAAMFDVMLTSRQPPPQVFTGINDLFSKGLFASLRGTPLSAMPAPWDAEPDNVAQGGNCIVMQLDGTRLDGKCSDLYPYICYIREKPSQVELCGTKDTKYVFNKHTKSCHKLHSKFSSWQEAYATCVREGAHLAILNSEYEAKTLARLIKHEWLWAHIGFSFWRTGLWMTIHGETLADAGFEDWAPGEPNDVNEERCGSMAADIWTLVDIDCEDRPRPFICERSNF